MEETRLKEVYFNEFCSECEFEKLAENKKPCDECLKEPVNEYSHKPVKFKQKEEK